jgi:hypothetical protein
MTADHLIATDRSIRAGLTLDSQAAPRPTRGWDGSAWASPRGRHDTALQGVRSSTVVASSIASSDHRPVAGTANHLCLRYGGPVASPLHQRDVADRGPRVELSIPYGITGRLDVADRSATKRPGRVVRQVPRKVRIPGRPLGRKATPGLPNLVGSGGRTRSRLRASAPSTSSPARARATRQLLSRLRESPEASRSREPRDRQSPKSQSREIAASLQNEVVIARFSLRRRGSVRGKTRGRCLLASRTKRRDPEATRDCHPSPGRASRTLFHLIGPQSQAFGAASAPWN